MDEPHEAEPAPGHRSRWPWIAGVVVLIVAVAVAASVVAGTGPDDEQRTATRLDLPAGAAETKALLDGVTQDGLTIGDPKAPITLLEYVDLQCPFCKVHQLEHTPELIDQLVRTGDAKISLVPLAFLGPDSIEARNVLLRLARKNRAWEFVNLFYWNQGEENSGYVTPDYVQALVAGVPDATPADASLAADPDDAEVALGADRLGQHVLGGHKAGTPGFAVGASNAPLPSYRWIPTYQEEPLVEQLVKAVREERKRLDRGARAAGTA